MSLQEMLQILQLNFFYSGNRIPYRTIAEKEKLVQKQTVIVENLTGHYFGNIFG